jgi:putative phosphonate metabolism protein
MIILKQIVFAWGGLLLPALSVDQGSRYAIYFVPAAQTQLYRYGSSILGYDCYSGRSVAFPEEAGGGAVNWNELTKEPRRYGFHATLKAPFHLLPSQREQQLVSAVQNFARLGHAVAAFTPTVRLVGDFFAVVPLEPVAAIAALAASCTTIFDAFRAPITPQERARRIALKLNDEQIRNLDRWGYPYVLSHYQFHMTLTGKVAAARRRAILVMLQKGFRRNAVERSIAIDRLALVKQESPAASFRIVCEAAIGGRA